MERNETIPLPKREEISANLDEIREVIHSINEQNHKCPFCDGGMLRVVDYNPDPALWLGCTECKAQLKLSKRPPEPILEKTAGTGREWEVHRATLDRDLRNW